MGVKQTRKCFRGFIQVEQNFDLSGFWDNACTQVN